MKVLSILIILVSGVACSSPDDLVPMGEAANRAAGGAADAATGSREIALSAQVSQTGDQTQEAWSLKVQRNNSSQASGASYALASIASGGGADAMQRDPIVKLIQDELAALSSADSRPTERLDTLRAELAVRLTTLQELQARTQPANVHDNVMIVVAPQAVGKDQPLPTAVDAELAREIQSIIGAARNTSRPTSRPDNP